jgi:hypothetical protein
MLDVILSKFPRGLMSSEGKRHIDALLTNIDETFDSIFEILHRIELKIIDKE